MKYFLSAHGLQELDQFSRDDVLVALDFDGTLAPITDQPSGAQMPASVAGELDQLCRLATVAIVSGRQLGDLRSRVTADVKFLIGNHGNEGLSGSLIDKDRCLDTCRDWASQLRHLPELHASGVSIEQKEVTLSIHYRHAMHYPNIREALGKAFDKLIPAPRVVSGDCVFNLIPPGAITKDAAMDVVTKLTGLNSVIYVGDDECDELVFASAQPGWITIRIGYWRQSAARYYLQSQHETIQLLKLLNLHLAMDISRDA